MFIWFMFSGRFTFKKLQHMDMITRPRMWFSFQPDFKGINKKSRCGFTFSSVSGSLILSLHPLIVGCTLGYFIATPQQALKSSKRSHTKTESNVHAVAACFGKTVNNCRSCVVKSARGSVPAIICYITFN